MTDNYDRRLKKRAIDSKTDLSTGTDEHWHVVFKLPTGNFLRLFKDKLGDFALAKGIIHRLGCRCKEEEILAIDYEEITDEHFGQGIQITVHEQLENPYLSKCDKCSLHFDTGES